MYEISDNIISNKIICSKGNMPLTLINNSNSNINSNSNNSNNSNNKRSYNLKFDFNDLNINKVNINSLLTTEIYSLIEKINIDLIENIYILNILNNNEADIIIFLKHIAKEVGLKQKFIMFRSQKIINNNNITFYNKDIENIDKNLYNNYLEFIAKTENVSVNKYEAITYHYGKIVINFDNINILKNLDANIYLHNVNNNDNFNKNLLLLNNNNDKLNMKFSMDFQLSIKDNLPIYMENIMGLMFKKIFHNLKLFIENLNNK